MDIFEKVVRAIAETQHQGWLYDEAAVALLDPKKVEVQWLHLRAAARAAIEAMREPTEEMKLAGSLDPGAGGPDPGYETDVWQAMIDEALSGQQRIEK